MILFKKLYYQRSSSRSALGMIPLIGISRAFCVASTIYRIQCSHEATERETLLIAGAHASARQRLWLLRSRNTFSTASYTGFPLDSSFFLTTEKPPGFGIKGIRARVRIYACIYSHLTFDSIDMNAIFFCLRI